MVFFSRNPNEDPKFQTTSGGNNQVWIQQQKQRQTFGKVETGTGGSSNHRSFGSSSFDSTNPGGHEIHIVEDGESDLLKLDPPPPPQLGPDRLLGRKILRQKQQQQKQNKQQDPVINTSEQQQHQQQLPEPILVDWPQYESLDKKYLVLGKT